MAELLTPLAEAIGEHVRQGETLHADDTPVPVLEPGRGKTRTGRYGLRCGMNDRGDQRSRRRLFTNTRRIEPANGPKLCWRAARAFCMLTPMPDLTAFTTSIRKRVFRRLLEVSCWAHARRKIYEVFEATKSPVALGSAWNAWASLFDIERAINGKPPDERKRIRTERSVPLLDELKQAFEAALNKISGKSTLAGAIRYAHGRWASLTRYTTDGRLEMTNNAAERAIRPLALGRKNWLFAGSDTGGERAAIMYTIIETAKMNSLDPEAYLRDIIARIADHPINKIDELLPWNVRK